MISANKKHLLVEGNDDCYAIAELIGKHVAWGKKPNVPVQIKVCGGVSEWLDDDNFIPTLLRSNPVEILGIIIDADDAFSARWNRLRSLCISAFPGLPTALPQEGLIANNAEAGKRLGVWIMPDNKSKGMIETFMKFLIPNAQNPVWRHAEKSTSDAQAKGAKYRVAHQEKANIYTWLAWQDEPGQNLGRALMQNILNGQAPYATPFVSWFRKLFELEQTFIPPAPSPATI